MGFIIYLYWRFYRGDDNGAASWSIQMGVVIQILLFLMIHILTIVFIVDGYLGTNFHRVNGWIGDNSVENRLLKIPLLLLPLVILIIVFYRLNRKKFEEGVKKLDEMSEQERKKKNRLYWIYVTVTMLLFALSLTSSSWFK